MTKVVVLGVLLISLVSIPVLMALSKLNLMKNALHFTCVGTICSLVVVGGAALLFHRYFKRVDPAMYAFTFFAWTGLLSLLLAFEMDGYIPKFLEGFIQEGEPYLKSAYGTVISYWDGTVQTSLCLAAIALYTHRESHREVTLYWAGSLLNSVLVLFLGAMTGPHDVKSAMFCNIIYFGIPLLLVVRYLHRSPIQARSFLQFPPIWRRPVDLFFVIFFKLAAFYVVFRLLTVLGGNVPCMKDYLKAYDPYLKDPNMFPKIQTLNYGYFFLAYYVMATYGLVFPGQHWMTDWSLIHAGAAAQAQFSYVAGALHHRTLKGYHPPTSGQAAYLFWTINILLFVVPQLFAFWCHRDFEKYGRSYTVDLAQPVKTYVVKTVTTTTITTSPRKDYSQRKDD